MEDLLMDMVVLQVDIVVLEMDLVEILEDTVEQPVDSVEILEQQVDLELLNKWDHHLVIHMLILELLIKLKLKVYNNNYKIAPPIMASLSMKVPP
jgi:hypothetical protein